LNIHDLPTPCLVVDRAVFDTNVAVMSEARPGLSLRPHVKAWKSTAIAAILARRGHTGFCAATPREVDGMAKAGLGDDLLLANEVIGDAAERLGRVGRDGAARVTLAVDSEATVLAAAAAGIREVLVDVDVGSFRCGCPPDDAGRLADLCRARGLHVRGVMGSEGPGRREMGEDKAEKVERAMAVLLEAHDRVGGDVISGGGTGTFDSNRWVTELQAGSFALMDRDYARLGGPFRPALHVLATIVSSNPAGGWAVANAGLKAIATDHGQPGVDGAHVLYVADEHTVFSPDASAATGAVEVGDRVRLLPGHIDPTVALHERMHVLDGDEVVDVWPVDLRGW
jgi:D-serine deaminase-like pyridoxal phosphate-dependent protein